MPSLSDLKRAWLLKMLGLSSSTLSESDLLAQLYSGSSIPVPAASVPAASYFFPVGSQWVNTISGLTNNQGTLYPWRNTQSMSIARLGCEVTTAGEAGSLVRLGIFKDNGSGRPGALTVDGGTVSSATTGVKEVTVSASLDPGVYWLAAVCQSAATTRPVLRCLDAHTLDSPLYSATLPVGGSRWGSYLFTASGALTANPTVTDPPVTLATRLVLRTA